MILGFELEDLGRGFILGHENTTHWSTSHASNCMVEMGVRQIFENKSVVVELITGFGYNQEGITLCYSFLSPANILPDL